jgi:hypothetical protein
VSEPLQLEDSAFVVEDPGSPEISIDAAAATAGSAAPAVAGELVVTAWTPEKAQLFLGGLIDAGGMPFYRGDLPRYQREWKTKPPEFAGWDESAARLLGRFVPAAASGAGPVGIAVDLILTAAGLVAMGLPRGQAVIRLRKEGDETATEAEVAQHVAQARPAQRPQTAATPRPGESDAFKFDPAVSRALGPPSTGLEHLGIS